MELNEEENPIIKKMACAAWTEHYHGLGIFRRHKIKRVQKELEKNGLFLTKKEILFYCRDLIKERT